jgi:hypothetical protein
MALEQLQLLEQQIGQLDQELATLLHPHQDAVQRLGKCRVWEWTRRTLLKLVLPQQPFRRGNSSPRGWAPAPATKRAPA